MSSVWRFNDSSYAGPAPVVALSSLPICTLDEQSARSTRPSKSVRNLCWFGPRGIATIKLKEPTQIKLIRLLNTTNAGLNDLAAVDCEVELLDKDETPVWSKPVVFGRPWDRSFGPAFARPEFFESYR